MPEISLGYCRGIDWQPLRADPERSAWRPDEVYDRTDKDTEPASFTVNEVIKGWAEVLPLMKVGSKWQIVVPAELAYGEKGAGLKIGPNSTLIFEIELLGIES